MFPNLQASLEVIFDKYDVILLSTALSIAFAYIYLTITQYEKQVASGKAKIEQAEKLNRSLEQQIQNLKAYNKYLPRQSPLVSDRKPRSLSCTDPVISTPSASNSSNDLVSLLLPIKNSLSNPQLSRKAEVRIWMDGAFDLMHYGHMNAFRQGRALGTTLIVGVNSDETITQCKGKPVFNDQERLDMVKACKWVDKVVEGVPYIMSEEYIAYVIEKYKIDFVVHGDDPCIVDGKDVYESAKKLGKYMSVPRTEGVSTTDIVGRMLMMSNAHLDLEHHTHEAFNTDQDTAGNNSSADKQNIEATEVVNTEVTQDASKCEVSMHDRDKSIAANSHVSHSGAPILDPFEATVSALGLNRKSNFLTTSTIMKLFSADIQPPKPYMKVVYIPGSWDMFHSGHVAVLQEARRYGDYVIVGVHGDSVVNALRGHHFPIMNLHERVLSVLGCKHVDDVLIDAPYMITREMLASMHVSVVLTRKPHDTVSASSDSLNNSSSSSSSSSSGSGSGSSSGHQQEYNPLLSIDPYTVPQSMGILHTLDRKYTMSIFDILAKVEDQKESLTKKFDRKRAQEQEFYARKYGNII